VTDALAPPPRFKPVGSCCFFARGCAIQKLRCFVLLMLAPFERGEIGSDLFSAACRMGLEGLVSKHRDRPYQAGRSRHWVKVKNRKHPAMCRVMDALA